MTKPNFHLDLPANSNRSARDFWLSGTVTERVAGSQVAVRIDGSDLPDVVAPAAAGVTAVGAPVRLKMDTSGRVVEVAAPDRLPEGAVPVYVGGTGEYVEKIADAQVELDTAMGQAREDISENRQEIDHLRDETIPGLRDQIVELDETTIPGLSSRLEDAEQTLAPLPGRISAAETAVTGAQEDLDDLNSVKLPALGEAMKDAERITEGTLDNERLAVGELSALIANVIELNVSRLVASDAAIDTAVINRLAVGIATVIELSADRITSGQIDAARINVAELAVELATVLHLDVGQLVASDAAIDTAVISKLSVGIATVIELNVSRLVADDAQLGTAVAQRIVADTAAFLKITTDMLIAGGAKITGPLLADTIQLATRLVAGDPSGDRTELNGSGIHIFKGGVERVRLSAEAKNGLQVWNPSMAAMVDLSDSMFGTRVFQRDNRLDIPPPTQSNTWGAWVFDDFAATFTATTNRILVSAMAQVGDYDTWQRFRIRAVANLVVNGVDAVKIYETGEDPRTALTTREASSMGVFDVVAGQTYTVRFQFRAMKADPSATGRPWISNRVVTIQPA